MARVRNAHSSFTLISKYLLSVIFYYMAAAKMTIMRQYDIHVVDSPAEIGETMLRVLGGK